MKMKKGRGEGRVPGAGEEQGLNLTSTSNWLLIIIIYTITDFPTACKYRFKSIQVIYTIAIVTKLSL
jgi:hypothetical protein